MANFIAILFIVVVVGIAIRYIYKNKKNGGKCIGCPHCSSGSGCGCGCTGSQNK